jgi:hypothetical protein
MKCDFAKSDMTPCVRRDGAICYATDQHGNPICVGCERTPSQTGVPFEEKTKNKDEDKDDEYLPVTHRVKKELDKLLSKKVSDKIEELIKAIIEEDRYDRSPDREFD